MNELNLVSILGSIELSNFNIHQTWTFKLIDFRPGGKSSAGGVPLLEKSFSTTEEGIVLVPEVAHLEFGLKIVSHEFKSF